MTVHTIILSAGKSSRIGTDKALLKIGNLTFAERLTALFAQVSDSIFLVVSPELFDKLSKNKPYLPKTRLIINPKPETGRMSSVITGVKHSGIYPTFLHNIDIPAIQAGTLQTLLAHYDAQKIIIPSYRGAKGHPILLGEKIIPALLNQPASANLKDFVKSNDLTIVNVNDPAVLQNINTRNDYIQLIDTFSK